MRIWQITHPALPGHWYLRSHAFTEGEFVAERIEPGQRLNLGRGFSLPESECRITLWGKARSQSQSW